MEGGYVSPSLLIVSRMVANIADRGVYPAQHTATLRSLVSLLREAANDGERRSLQYKRVRLHGLLQRMKPGDVLLYQGGWTAPGNDTSRTQQRTVANECRLPVTDDGHWCQTDGGHAIMLYFERHEDTFSLVTLNTGEGIRNHPSCDAYYPKVKRKTALR